MAIISKVRPLIRPSKLMYQSIRKSGGHEMNVKPTGFEPEDWECERNPVSRLLAKYCLPDSIYAHEWRVAKIAQEQDSRIVKMTIDQIKRTQLIHRDYRAWYYQPTDLAKQTRADRYEKDKQKQYENLRSI